MNMIVVIVACKNKKEATTISKALLDKRLIACAKVTTDVHSMYFWPAKSGKIEESDEVLLICETLEEKWSELEKESTKLSSYDTPSILALPVSHVSPKYLDWLTKEII